MKETFSKKDYELISGYMDQELSDAEILSFAERLAEGDGLDKELAELMQVKSMLKEMPEMPAPRNYFLTRAMAEEARKPGLLERLFPFFKISTALCALLLALTFIFPRSLGINPRSDYAALADEQRFEAAEDAAAPALDQHISVPGGAGFGGGGQTVSMPSRGTIGGNPQNQYRIAGGLQNHPDHMDIIWPEDNAEVIERGEVDPADETGADQTREKIERKMPLSDLLKILFGSLLAVSMVCVAVVLRKRAKLHLPDTVEKVE